MYDQTADGMAINATLAKNGSDDLMVTDTRGETQALDVPT